MSRDGMYLQQIKLHHDEIGASINSRTGEVTAKPLKKYVNNIPEGREIFGSEGMFKKTYDNSWRFLRKYLTTEEVFVVTVLADRAFTNTNSLKPLNDDTAITDMAEIFGVSRNILKDMFAKLFKLGVYGKFDVYDVDRPYTKHWIFNPYLSFAGKTIKSDIAGLFSGTHCAKAFYNENYALTDKQIKELTINPKIVKKRKNLRS